MIAKAKPGNKIWYVKYITVSQQLAVTSIEGFVIDKYNTHGNRVLLTCVNAI